jgi:hypothetical protein
MSCAGQSTLEYAGLVAAVAIIIGALLIARPHVVGRTPPLRPVTPLARLLQPLERPRPARPARPAPPRRPTRPRTRRPSVVVRVPDWALGR